MTCHEGGAPGPLLLPGGHQEPGEALDQAVIREVYEETAAKVSVLDLVLVYEHIYPSKKEQRVVTHSIEFAFLCSIEGHYKSEMGKHPDHHQVAVEWIDVSSLKGLSFLSCYAISAARGFTRTRCSGSNRSFCGF